MYIQYLFLSNKKIFYESGSIRHLRHHYYYLKARGDGSSDIESMIKDKAVKLDKLF